MSGLWATVEWREGERYYSRSYLKVNLPAVRDRLRDRGVSKIYIDDEEETL